MSDSLDDGCQVAWIRESFGRGGVEQRGIWRSDVLIYPGIDSGLESLSSQAS